MSIAAVRNDLMAGSDAVSDWAKDRDAKFFRSPSSNDLTALGDVSKWINNHQTYSRVAKDTFLNCSDLFVVAQALTGGHTVVTHEKPENSTIEEVAFIESKIRTWE